MSEKHPALSEKQWPLSDKHCSVSEKLCVVRGKLTADLCVEPLGFVEHPAEREFFGRAATHRVTYLISSLRCKQIADSLSELYRIVYRDQLLVGPEQLTSSFGRRRDDRCSADHRFEDGEAEALGM